MLVAQNQVSGCLIGSFFEVGAEYAQYRLSSKEKLPDYTPKGGPRGKMGRRGGGQPPSLPPPQSPGEPSTSGIFPQSPICSVFRLFFAGLLLKCTTNINRPHRAAPCGSACRLLTEAGGWWSSFSAVRSHCGIKGRSGRWEAFDFTRALLFFVGFHLFMAFMVGCQKPVLFDLLIVPHVLSPRLCAVADVTLVC